MRWCLFYGDICTYTAENNKCKDGGSFGDFEAASGKTKKWIVSKIEWAWCDTIGFKPRGSGPIKRFQD